MLIDAHCHLNFKDYLPEEIPVLLERARAQGVERFINIGAGDGFEGNLRAIELASQDPHIYATVGIHPHDAQIVTPEILSSIEKLLDHEKVVALGEIGLDFHYLHSPEHVQEEVLDQFLALAKKKNKPVMVHDRSAEDKTFQHLKKSGIPGERIMIHCFTGGNDLAKTYLNYGCTLSFTGIITFKKSEELRKVVAFTPLDQLLVETDSPFLTPEPFRGKRNEPAHVRLVAEAVARIKGISLEEVAVQTSRNATEFFGLSL